MLRGASRQSCALAAVVVGSLVGEASEIVSYCLPRPEAPCWGVRKTLTEQKDGPFPLTVDGFSGLSRHQAVDWNGDGYLDLILGLRDGAVLFFQGDEDGNLTELKGRDNPFNDTFTEQRAAPQAVDWDGDGRMDLILSDSHGGVYFYLGSSDGNVTLQTGASNPFESIDIGREAVPHAVDWDGDGHKDLLVGTPGGEAVRFFRGGPNGSLSQLLGTANPFADIRATADSLSLPQAADWDGDARWDLLLVSSSWAGSVRFFRGHADGSLREDRGSSNPFRKLDLLIGGIDDVQSVDWDSDGHLDLLVRKGDVMHLFRGGVDDRLVDQTWSMTNPLAGIEALPDHPTTGLSFSHMVDWDGDGHLDLLVARADGKVGFLRGGADGSFAAEEGEADPFDDLQLELFSSDGGGLPTARFPWAVDWNGDGQKDLLLGSESSVQLLLGRANGSVSEQTGEDNPFEEVGGGRPQAVDWDQDGRMDLLLSGDDGGGVRFYQGTANGSLRERTGTANPFDGIHAWFAQAVDWDGDGHQDLLVDNSTDVYSDARFFQGGADGSLAERTGTANPLHGLDMRLRLPQALDVDGDGRLDLLMHTLKLGEVYLFSSRCDSTEGGQRAVCSGAGWCGFTARCACVASNDNPDASDCSLCADFYHKSPGSQRCQPCPGLGTTSGTCSSRGVCWDTAAAREARRDGTWMPTQRQAPGNGTCVCEHPFSGSSCGEGTCPPGKEEAFTDTHPLSSSKYRVWETCVECAPGRYKALGSASCTLCAPGTFQSAGGASVCDPCPPGTNQPSSGRTLCEPCVAGRHAGPGEASCAQCQRNLVATSNRSSCEPCPGGSVASNDQTTCEQCGRGFQAAPGEATCSRCGLGSVTTSDRDHCRFCPAGSEPNWDQSDCQNCSAGRYAEAGQATCSPCEAGSVTNSDRSGCQACTAGTFAASEGRLVCFPCGSFYTSTEGSSACHLHPVVLPASIGTLLSVLAVVGLRWLRQQRWRRAIALAMEGSSAARLRGALEWGSKAGLRRAELEPGQRSLQVLERKYLDHEYLLRIVREGDLKLIRGSWLADERNGGRLMRQQDLPQEAFWTVDDLRAHLRAVAFVAVSYCWLHEVHPDPQGVHLRTLRRALKLRLRWQGPGQVMDIALFFDYCSLAQHGEKGDPAHPERGELRTPEQQASFHKGLRQVNIPYANQSVEVWMMQWTPESERRTYMTRGWPYFEQAVAGLIKDPDRLLLILPESQRCQNWPELYDAAVGGRQPPLTPSQFNDELDGKTFTSPSTDKALVIKKYEETFHEVLGHAATLWFANLGWDDEQAAQLARVLPHCHELDQLILGSNLFTAQGAESLAAAAEGCPVRGMDLTGNPIEGADEERIRRRWQGAGKAPGLLSMGTTLVPTPKAQPIVIE